MSEPRTLTLDVPGASLQYDWWKDVNAESPDVVAEVLERFWSSP